MTPLGALNGLRIPATLLTSGFEDGALGTLCLLDLFLAFALGTLTTTRCIGDTATRGAFGRRACGLQLHLELLLFLLMQFLFFRVYIITPGGGAGNPPKPALIRRPRH